LNPVKDPGFEAWDALDSMDLHPSQGAHTSHLRTLSKIGFRLGFTSKATKGVSPEGAAYYTSRSDFVNDRRRGSMYLTKPVERKTGARGSRDAFLTLLLVLRRPARSWPRLDQSILDGLLPRYVDLYAFRLRTRTLLR
jgi:hypothetical protein